MNTNHSASRASFLELYIVLARALASRKGSKFIELNEQLVLARKLHGDELTTLIQKWASMAVTYGKEIRASDASFIIDKGQCPLCLKILCLDKIYSDPSFSTKSKLNLWQYLSGLVYHAAGFRTELEAAVGHEDDLPAPFAEGGSNGVEFGSDTADSAQVINDLAGTLPPNVLRKMHGLANTYQEDLKEGRRTPSDLHMASVLGDVFKTLDTNDVMDVVSNLGMVVQQMQKAQEMPEIQALMKAMREQRSAPQKADTSSENKENDPCAKTNSTPETRDQHTANNPDPFVVKLAHDPPSDHISDIPVLSDKAS
jgi:hypothetical protein